MSDDNKAIVRRFLEEGDTGNMDSAIEFLAPDFVWHGPQGQMDREACSQFKRMTYSAFPDLNHTIEDQIAERDLVVTRETLRGTHKGEFQGIAPTEKRVTFTGILIDRVSEGKIIERWIEFDVLGLMQQLGAIAASK